MREGTAKEIKFESIDNLFGIPNESKQHVTTMIPLAIDFLCSSFCSKSRRHFIVPINVSFWVHLPIQS